ncbi:hypothetical protein [Acetobacter nitrogenifigens]|uniref:hypothetical protein n=1 Tax=Acetobacter nitrogenifigens TaxID=285268 RepID=UPI000410928A|nr:hypothetical protein [Acetobacter nitrogenifigens]
MTIKDEAYFRMRDIITRCLQDKDYEEPSYEDLADDIIKSLHENGYSITNSNGSA